MKHEPIEKIIKYKIHELTRTEKQLAHRILENYPFSSLGTLSDLAKSAQVSMPTVVRMVKKLGFSSFPEFQSAIKVELEAKVKTPIKKHENWVSNAKKEHILNRFTDACLENIRHSLELIHIQTFDKVCDILADDQVSLYVAGGRITRTLADYFFLHLQVIRSNVTLIQLISNSWPHYLLDIKKGDVLVIFDVRRYETSSLKMAEMAYEKGARIILFTDQWRSPIDSFSEFCFSSKIEVPSAWDSNVNSLILIESMISQIQELKWGTSENRIETLEQIFDKTGFFRKF